MDAIECKRLLTETETAEFTRIKLWTLRRWRSEGRGPHFIKAGGTLVRYRFEDIQTFLDTCPVGGAGERVHAR